MKKVSWWIFIPLLTLLLCSPVYAGWKEKIVRNQINAIAYIEQLKAGAGPDQIERPKLRRDKHSRANAANREIKEAMAKAEGLARQGKNSNIEIPQFQIQLVSDEKWDELEIEPDK